MAERESGDFPTESLAIGAERSQNLGPVRRNAGISSDGPCTFLCLRFPRIRTLCFGSALPRPLDFVKKDGSTRPKVFKLKSLEMTKGETRVLSKNHRMLATASTFTLYPGTHRLRVQINGREATATEFDLVS